MAEYMMSLRTALGPENAPPLDENSSHVIGRAWRDIDYRGEGLSWEKQQSVYAPNGVVDFKTAEHLALFFRIESKAAYFQKLYRPRGAPP